MGRYNLYFFSISLHQRALAENTFQIMMMDRCKISKCEVVPGAPDRVNIHCLMYDTRLLSSKCKNDNKLTLTRNRKFVNI